jgi:hypothetical protein
MSIVHRTTSHRGEHHAHVPVGASVLNTGADVRLCFAPLMRRWQKWRGRKVADEMREEKAAAVLASAAILYHRERPKHQQQQQQQHQQQQQQQHQQQQQQQQQPA